MAISSRVRTIGLALAAALLVLAGWALAAKAQSSDPAQIELGGRLYAENCAVCHGENGEGRVGATLAKNWPSIRPDLRVKATIANGISGSVMPAWSDQKGGPLSEADIEAVTAYILTWETGGPRYIAPTPTAMARPALTPPPNVEGDPNRGGILYDENCAVCHGMDGEGRIGAVLAKDWPSIRPDLSVKTTISNGIGGSPMPAWSQTKGGPLSEEQINDLTAFILSWEPLASPLEITATPEAAANPFLSGWGGVLLLIVIFGLVIGVALWWQSRSPAV